MGTTSSATIAIHPALAGRAKDWLRRYFYFGMTLLCAAIIVWGFGHTVPDVLLHPAIPRPKILWLHAIVFSGWLLFAIIQTALVRLRKVKVHRVLGWFGAGLATTMVVVGVTTAIQLGRFDVKVLHQAGADTFEIVSFSDMLLFATVIALAIAYRRNLEVHRRLLLLGTVALTGAAFGRIDWLAERNLPAFCSDAVMCLGVLRDRMVMGRVHRVYWIAIPIYVAWHAAVTWMYVYPPAWWATLAHRWMG